MSSLPYLVKLFALIKVLDPRITYLEVIYSGSGDSGGIERVIAKAGSELLEPSTALNDFISDTMYELVELYHPGFEINEGGNGTLRFDILKGLLQVESVNMIPSEDWDPETNDPGEPSAGEPETAEMAIPSLNKESDG